MDLNVVVVTLKLRVIFMNMWVNHMLRPQTNRTNSALLYVRAKQGLKEKGGLTYGFYIYSKQSNLYEYSS